MSTPRNRRERRAAGKSPRSAADIPMSQPDRSGPKSKTLFDLAAEREAELSGRRQAARPSSSTDAVEAEPTVVTLNPDGTISGPDGEVLPAGMSAQIKASMGKGQAATTSDDDDKTEPDDAPLAEALLYTITLSALYFTLSVLVLHQYGMSKQLPWKDLVWQTLGNAPFLLIVIWLLHPRAGTMWAQALFLAMNIACGMWMITAAHEYGYMAVMKKAPGAGTLWVWSVLENRLELAAMGLVVVGAYFWWGDYSLLGQLR